MDIIIRNVQTLVCKLIPINLCSDWFFILLPRRSFLTEQLSQDVAEMLLVVQKEVDDDGTWLKPDDTRKWFNGTFSLSMRCNRERETLERRKALWRERHYRKILFTDTHTQREVWENDRVFKGTCFPSYEGAVYLMSHWLCACGGDATIAVPVTLLSHSLPLSSQELPSLTLSLSMHSTAEVDQKCVCLCYNYAQKGYSSVQVCIIHGLLDISVHLTMHKQGR